MHIGMSISLMQLWYGGNASSPPWLCNLWLCECQPTSQPLLVGNMSRDFAVIVVKYDLKKKKTTHIGVGCCCCFCVFTWWHEIAFIIIIRLMEERKHHIVLYLKNEWTWMHWQWPGGIFFIRHMKVNKFTKKIVKGEKRALADPSRHNCSW